MRPLRQKSSRFLSRGALEASQSRGLIGRLTGAPARLLNGAQRGGLRLFQPVALAVQLQNMDMVGEAIEQGAGQTLIPEDARPFLEWQI